MMIAVAADQAVVAEEAAEQSLPKIKNIFNQECLNEEKQIYFEPSIKEGFFIKNG